MADGRQYRLEGRYWYLAMRGNQLDIDQDGSELSGGLCSLGSEEGSS